MSIQKVDKTTGDTSLICGSTNFSDSPIGTILPLMSNNIPTGFLLCDNTAYRASDYPELWAILPSTVKDTVNNTFTIDLRESSLKGTGLTSKSNNHYDADGLALGEFIEDRLQDWRDGAKWRSFGPPDTSGWDFATKSSSGSTIAGRFGATTEVKAVGVNYIIKAKMVAMPSDFMSKVDEAVESYVKHVTKNGRTGVPNIVTSKWDIIEFGDNFALCIGVNTSGVTLSSLAAVNLALPDGYTGVNIISANGFASGNTAWVTATSHVYSYDGGVVGATTYLNAGTYGTGQIREILIATKS